MQLAAYLDKKGRDTVLSTLWHMRKAVTFSVPQTSTFQHLMRVTSIQKAKALLYERLQFVVSPPHEHSLCDEKQNAKHIKGKSVTAGGLFSKVDLRD